MRNYKFLLGAVLVLIAGCDHKTNLAKNEPSKDTKIKPYILEPDDKGQLIDWGAGNNPRLAFSGRRVDKDGSVRHELNITDIGLQRFEDGVNYGYTWERWDLKIANPSYGYPFKGTHCELTRNRFTKGVTDSDTYIFVDYYSNSDRSIIIDREDWDAGAINLRVDWGMGKGSWYYTDGNLPLNIEIRFKQVDGLFTMSNLNSLRVTSAVRDYSGEKKLHLVEYKILDYDQVVMMPVKLQGVKEAGMKKWNEMIATLSKEDQDAWEAMKSNRKALEMSDYEQKQLQEQITKKIPGNEDPKFKPTPEQAKFLEDLILDSTKTKFKGFLEQGKLSSAAKTKMVDLLVADMEQRRAKNP